MIKHKMINILYDKLDLIVKDLNKTYNMEVNVDLLSNPLFYKGRCIKIYKTSLVMFSMNVLFLQHN